MKRRALWWLGGTLLAGGVVALLLGSVAAMRALRLPPESGEVRVEGLASSVRVLRDDFGVPHVEAEGPLEALSGLGFAHAQDRLFQMELLRRSARGTLSELFGRETLPADRLARTLGLAHAAERELERLDPRSRSRLLAYARGVNAWVREIEARRVPRPLEFGWLDLEPGLWDPVDTLAIVRLRAWMLGRSLGATLLLDRLVREMGGVASEPFFPSRPEAPPPETTVKLWLDLGRVADGLAAVSGLRGRVGSLGFVVGPGRSASGLPLLANDPHVEFQLPAVFYVAHLRAPGLEVAGATWPGVPVFWTAVTGRTAWGQVALHASVSDLFEETLDPSDPSRYDVAGRWVPFERREEAIQIRGGGEEGIEIRTTRHGPLLASVLPGEPAARTLALRWTGAHPDSGLPGLLELPHVAGFQEFREALRDLPAPPTVFLYADRGGAAGVQVAGHLPLRPIDTGLLPVPGRLRWYDWRGTLPFDDLPTRILEKAESIVVGPRAEELRFPVPVAWLWSATAAPARLRGRLDGTAPLGLQEVTALQRETRNSGAVDEIARLLEGVDPRSATARRVYDLLVDWDGSAGADAVGPAVYHTFRARLLGQLLERHLPRERIRALLELAEPVPGAVLVGYMERSPDDVDPGVVQAALEETWGWLASRVSPNPAKWAWGRVHRVRLRHPFERIGGGLTYLLGRRLSRGPFSSPGDPGSAWTMYADGRDPFDPRVGPAFRLAVDLGDPAHPRFGLCGGQSALPGSPNYTNGVADWIAGRPRILWIHAADVAYHARGAWELRPGLP